MCVYIETWNLLSILFLNKHKYQNGQIPIYVLKLKYGMTIVIAFDLTVDEIIHSGFLVFGMTNFTK